MVDGGQVKVEIIDNNQGIARTQSPTNKNYALELPTFGVIVEVSPTEVQWKGLALEEPPSWSRLTSVPGKYAETVFSFRIEPGKANILFEHFFHFFLTSNFCSKEIAVWAFLEHLSLYWFLWGVNLPKPMVISKPDNIYTDI